MRRGAAQEGSGASPVLHRSLLWPPLSTPSPILVQLWLDCISQSSSHSAGGGEEVAAASSPSTASLCVSSPCAGLKRSGGVQVPASRWRPPQQSSAMPALHFAHSAALSPLALSPLPHPLPVGSSPADGAAEHRPSASSPPSSRSPSPLTLLSSASSPPAAPGTALRAMWLSMSAQHAEEVERLLSRLRDAAPGSSLQAWLTSRLRLTEMAFASSRRRIILSTVARLQQTARRAALRRAMQRWRAVTASQRQAQCRAVRWAEQRRQRAAARDRQQAVSRWQQLTSDSRAGDAIAQSRRQRLLRCCLLHWRQRLSRQMVKQRAALQFAQAHSQRETRRLLLQWLWLAGQRHRQRHQQLALVDWSRRRRLTALWRVLAAWRQWSERQWQCTRRVVQVMQRVATESLCSVSAALLFAQQHAEFEAAAVAGAANVRYRIVAYDFLSR